MVDDNFQFCSFSFCLVFDGKVGRKEMTEEKELLEKELKDLQEALKKNE